jgi:tRNA-dihydrouridine synthase 1
MLHSKNFVTDPTFRKSHLDLWEAGATYPELLRPQLECLGELPPPLGPTKKEASAPLMVQLAGNDVDMVVKAAMMIMEHTDGNVSGFDLNCGCPQGIARKGNYGAFLMEQDFDRVCEILKALRRVLPAKTVVSAKIRLPLDDATLQERIPRLVETGIHFLTIHGRTIKENKTKVGVVHADRIRLAVEAAHKVDPSFPIVANGGMENYKDVQDILQSTGCVAGMSSEALLETPNIFQPSSMALSPRETFNQQFSFARDYLDICANVAPPLPGVLGLKNGGSSSMMRGHLLKFLFRYIVEQPDLRDRFTADRSRTITQSRDLVNELEERYSRMSEDEFEACKSASAESSWYRRHRKAGRRVHQKEIIGSSSLSSFVPEEISMEERKRQIQERIKQMKEQKKENQGDAARFV